MSRFHDFIRKSATRAAFVASLGLFGCAQQTTLHGCHSSHRAPPRPCPISIQTSRPSAPKPVTVVAPMRIEFESGQDVAVPKPAQRASESVLVPVQQKPTKARFEAVDLENRSGSSAVRAAGTNES